MRKPFFVFFSLALVMAMMNVGACSSVQQVLAGTPTPTPTITPTSTPTITPTITPTPTKTPTPTITPNLTATQQYETFSLLVQKVFDAGQISTTAGTYQKLEDYSEQLSRSFGYNWTNTGVRAKDFIVRADFSWMVADQKNYSGCGFVFREKSDEFYYLIALDGLDGVLLSYTKEGFDALLGTKVYNYSIAASKRTKLPDMGSNPYRATFTLVINEFKAFTYINDNYYSEYELQKNWLTEMGPLSFLILTGSDKDYGTRCDITNAEVWIINQ